MTNLELEAEQGLQAYKAELMGQFGDTDAPVDAEDIRQRLADEGIVTQSPIITIPFTVRATEAAIDITKQSEWHDPFMVPLLEEASEIRQAIDQGDSIRYTNFPTVFYSSLLDLAVIFDYTSAAKEELDDAFVEAEIVTAYAHELAHSASANITSNQYHQTPGSDEVVITQTHMIAQDIKRTALRPGSSEQVPHLPTWIDEAFAARSSALVRAIVFPGSLPTGSHYLNQSSYGVTEPIEIPAHYLVHSDMYPNQPGDIPGSVAGMGLDLLIDKYPAIEQDLKAITIGRLGIGQFHQTLKSNVGDELYSAMTERRPYQIWGSVLNQIKEL